MGASHGFGFLCLTRRISWGVRGLKRDNIHRVSGVRRRQVFEGEFRELGRLIEHDRKMRDYMKLKSKVLSWVTLRASCVTLRYRWVFAKSCSGGGNSVQDQEELMRSSNGDDGHKKRSVVRASAAMHTGSGQLASVSADKGEVRAPGAQPHATRPM